MIFEQDDSYLEASRSGPYVELEFWSRGRHRGFVQVRASQVHPAIREGREISSDGLHIRPTEEGAGWVVEYAARNFRTTFRLSEDEVEKAFFAEGEE